MPANGEERRTYDLCTGENIKLEMILSQDGFGKLSLFGMFSGMHAIDDAVPEDGSDDFTSVVLLGFSYEHRIVKNLYAGISYNSYFKNWFYDSDEDRYDSWQFLSLFCKLKVR